MTYDFHGDWEQSVGHNSPLFPLNGASAYHKKLTVDFSVGEWHRKGAAKEKLVVGKVALFTIFSEKFLINFNLFLFLFTIN